MKDTPVKRLVFRMLVIAAVCSIAHAKYSGGSGTAGNPYKIGSSADLLALAADTNDYNKCFILTADINLASYTFPTAVIASDINNANYEFDGNSFSGVFDGNYYTIRNLTINTLGAGNDYLGLFGQIGPGGEIKNLAVNITITIASSDISYYVGGLAGYNNRGTINDCRPAGTVAGGNNSQYIGGLVGRNAYGDINDCYSTASVTHGNYGGYLGGTVGENYGIINHCYSAGSVTGGNNLSYLGGLVGRNASGTVSNCISAGAVTGTSDSLRLGGLAGGNNRDIHNCYSTSNVTGGNTSYNTGGLVGYNDSNISDCNSRGNVTSGDNSNATGGLVGWNSDGGNITRCYATGNIAGGNNAYNIGGLVGYNSPGSISNCYATGAVVGWYYSNAVGGLVGWNNDGGSITKCYSAGNVTGQYHLGGLVGYNTHSSVSGCYFLDTSGPDNGREKPLTDAEMKRRASFVGWDFIGEIANGTDEIWSISEGVSYPKLGPSDEEELESVLTITKCTVTAGKKENSDKISFSGTMNALADDFDDANTVEVTVDSNDPNDPNELVSPCVQTFHINSETWKAAKSKFSYSGTEDGIKKSFKYDLRTGKFSFAASKLDLCGLACPLTVQIEIGDYNAVTEVNEAVVNGPKKPIPATLTDCR